MSNDLLEKDRQGGNDYDDGQSWYRGSGSNDPKGDDLEAAYNAPSATDDDLPAGHPSREKKAYDGDALQNKEQSAEGANSFASNLAKESLYTGKALGAAMSKTPMGAMGRLRFILSTRKGRSAGVGGLIVTGLLIFFGFSAATLELTHIRNNVLDNSLTGRLQQLTLSERRIESLNRLATRSATYASRQTIDAVKLERKLNRAGLVVERAADGSVTRLTKNGEDIAQIIQRGGDDLIELSQDVNKVLKASDALYSGPATRNIIRARFGGIVSWLRGAPQEGETATQAVKRNLDEGTAVAEQRLRQEGAQTLDNLLVSGTSGAERAAGTVVGDASTSVIANATAGVADDTAAAAERAAGQVADEIAAASAESGGLTLQRLMDRVGPRLAQEAPSLFGRLATGAARAISITEPIRVGCTVRGTINFFSSIRNVQLAKLAATGFLRFMTVESELRSDVIRSTGMNMFMTALHANGGYMSSGAFQAKIGVEGAQSTSKERALYSNARAPTGVMGVLANIVNAVPGINNATVCRFAHNGLVIVGSTVIGAVVGFFSGGSTVAATGAVSIGLTFAQIVVEVVGVPLFARYLENRVSAAFAEEGSWGPTIAGGGSAFSAKVGGANGLGLSTVAQVSKLKQQEKVAREYRRSKESIFDRYFNIAKSDSLMGQLAFRTPKTPAAVADSTSRLAMGFGSNLGNAGMGVVASKLGAGKVYAAEANADCYQDEQLRTHNVALSEDGLCYPVHASAPDIRFDEAERILLQQGDIDGAGLIVSDGFRNYVLNCFSGRSGILYAEEVDRDGRNDPRDNTCVDPGPAVSGAQYGLNVYRHAYYGMVVDTDALVESINDEFENTETEEDENQPGNNPTNNPVDNPTTIAEGDTSNVPCAAGDDLGVVDGYRQGRLTRIRICRVQRFVVNSQVSRQVNDMFNAAAQENINFFAAGATGGFRSMEGQISIYRSWCQRRGITPTPPPYPRPREQMTRCPGGGFPGYSNHQMGLALDLGCDGQLIPKEYDEGLGNRCFVWLQQNAGRYGFYEFGRGNSRGSAGYEAWHWSVDGN